MSKAMKHLKKKTSKAMKHLKKKWMSTENWREKRRNKDSGAVASPASLEALPIDSSGKSSTSDLTEPRTPNCPIRTPPEASMSDEPSKLVVASATEPISNISSDLTVTTDPGAEEGQPVRNSQDQQIPEYPISQRLWNKAYDSLEQDEDTADLVRSYAKILEKILHANRASDSSASEDDVSVERKAAADRQRYMRDLVAEGRKKFATTSKITGGLSNVVEYIQKAKGVVDLAVANIPQAALPWAGVCIGLQILSNPGKATKSNLEGIVYVISRMDWYCALSEHLLNEEELIESFESTLKELEKAIITLYKTLLLYQIKSACYYHQHRGLAILRGLASWDDWDSDLQSVKKAEDDVRKMSSQYQKEYERDRLRQLYNSGVHMEESLGNIHQDLQALINQQKSMWTDSKNEKCLQDLFVVDPRNNMRTIMQNKEELLADVYKWMFSSDEYAAFIDWDNEASHSSQCRLLWITGSAGTGKTMLLMGIIDELQRQFSSLAPRLSYFFCQATRINLNNATNALRSLIWMLLFQQPHLIKHIQPDYDHMGRALFENEDAFNALDSIFESMLEDPSLSPVYFIIDALDECEKGLDLLLRLISKSFTLSDRVKWLVSSRPEVLTQHDIQDELQHLESPHVSRILVELDHKRLKDPVNVYIEHKLSALKGRTGYSDEVLTNISAEVRQRANNIFLWVALVFKELSNVRGWDAVETIQHMPSGLPGLYDRIMVKIGAGDDVPQTVVEECGSFLTVTAETVSLIHQSAKDYLDENHKSKLWPGGVTQGHMDICERSIDAMSALRENIYGIKEQDADPKDVEIPNPDPLARHESAVRAVAFSPCGNFLASGSVEDTKNLRLWDVASGQTKHIFEVPSSVRIVIFSPSGKKLAAGSRDGTTWMCDVLSGQTEHTLNGFCFSEPCLAASPDWSKLASQADEKTIQVWDVTIWQPKRFEGHQRRVTAMVFSPGNKLLSGSMDGTIRVWDVATGQIEQTLEIQSTRFGMALSPEGSRLASFSGRIVQLWSTKTWRIEGKLEGHESKVTSVAFSPNGQILASASALGSVRLSEIPTGPAEYAFEGHSDHVTVLALSPDGTKLASGSNDTTVRIWDVTTGKTERVLPHSNQVTAVAFSPNGSALVSASGSAGIIHTWDTTTGGIKDTLRDPNPRTEHCGEVYSILYSLDGRKVAFTLSYYDARLWDVATGQVMVLPHYNMSRTGLAFSPDGTRLASVIYNQVVSLWNTTTGESEGFLKGHQDLIGALAFSPDGRKLASGSFDKTIRIWDVVTCQMERTLRCDQKNACETLLFSPNGSEVASRLSDNTIQVWDTTTGRAERTFRAHSASIATTVFDLDSTMTGRIIDHVGTLPFYSVDETRRWVTRNGTKFLYLPLEFRPDRILVISGGTLVTENTNRVTIMEFAEDARGSLIQGPN
ncbi:hypothetical protein NUW58_g4448 [Xylaria curta]|uniref:Uncharacterized protein n=1 Tax=Xylaria curta TaxID=42375 RepID=A0ACC1P8W3_9PEZI|nr:hypothetical protein NUW58_g4448 [Xylaria curta]